MANEITLKTRLLNLYDKYSFNSTNENEKLKKGEILFHEEKIATDNGEIPVVLMKVGNGTDVIDDLPIVAARAADVYAWAKAETKPEYQASEIKNLSSYISGQIKDTNTTYSFAIPTNGDNAGKLVITPSEGEATVLDLITASELTSILASYATKTYVDEAIEAAKKYADDNDKDTTYGIAYENKKIKLVAGGNNLEIDATPFIKDGMISDVAYNETTNNLTITFNTEAGKEEIVVPLVDLVDIYTGVTGDRVNVSVSSDNKISADIVNGSIGTTQLDDTVKASLAKADSALQAHQDISNLATKTEVENALKAAKKYADDNDTDTTYTAGTGIAISNANVISNTGVLKVEPGATNGTIKVDGTEVAVKGLGSAAYTNSNTYATAAQGATADSALQTVKVLGQSLNKTSNELTVAQAKTALGLGSAAYKADTAFDAAGAAAAAQSAAISAAASDATQKANAAKADAKAYADDLNTAMDGRVDALESKEDKDTTYSAGDGLALNGTVFSIADSSTGFTFILDANA